MVAADFLFAFLVAALLSSVLVRALGWGLPGRDAPWAGVLFLFMILFLAAWAGGVWVRPVGPSLWGSHWLTFLLVGAVVAVLVAASLPRRPRPRPAAEAPHVVADLAEERSLIGALFWVLLVILTSAIMARYLLMPL